MAGTPLSFPAVAVATIASFILYGGTIYFVAIAMNWRIDLMLERVRLGVVVQTWRRGFHGQIAVFAVALLVVLPLEAFAIGPGGGPVEPRFHPPDKFMENQDVVDVTGYSGEGNAPVDATPNTTGPIVRANVTLQWEDRDAREPPGGPFGLTPRNRPDTLRLTVKLPGGESDSEEATNDPTTRVGEIVLGPFEAPSGGNLTGWLVLVECVQAGDVTGRYITYAQDTGNAWTLYVDYAYLVTASGNVTT